MEVKPVLCKPIIKIMPDEIAAIVPILKGEKFLPQCLDSLLQQTYPLTKIIVVLDTSIVSNCFYQVFSQYRNNSKIEFWQSKETYGPTLIQDRLMQSREFKYFLIQDADDWSAKNRLEMLVHNLSENVEMVASSEIFFHANKAQSSSGRHAEIWQAKDYQDNPRLTLTKHPHQLMSVHWHTCLLSKSLFDRVGGMSGIKYVGGGIEFIARCIFTTDVKVLPNYLYFYRQLSNSFLRDRILGGKSKDSNNLYRQIAARIKKNALLVESGKSPNLSPIVPRTSGVRLYKWE